MATKKALVTGASSGIGNVFAKELAKQGYSVTCISRDETALKELLKNLGDGHKYIISDLTKQKNVDNIVTEIENGAYHLLINNAGYATYGRFKNVPLEEHQNVIELNVNALVSLSYAFLKNAKEGDALINVSSVLSRLPYPGGAIYSGTKGFVTNFTESLWYEYKNKGIYIQALLPGVTDTNFHNVAMGEKVHQVHTQKGYPPEVVVKESLKALKARKKPIVISGPKYKWLTIIATKLLSRKTIIEMMGKNSPGMKL